MTSHFTVFVSFLLLLFVLFFSGSNRETEPLAQYQGNFSYPFTESELARLITNQATEK